jgi:actin-related protein
MAQKHSVWVGGSTFATMVNFLFYPKGNFTRAVHTREEYLEKGPSCCRYNPVFAF